MDLHEALYTTRAMRRVRPDPIPLDVQSRILDAAIRAPSGGNQQNWRFLLVDDPAIRGSPRPPLPRRAGPALGDHLRPPAGGGPGAPRRRRPACASRRSPARPSGWPTTSSRCRSSSSPSASTTRPAARSTPPSGAPCWPPGPRGWAAASRWSSGSSTWPRRSRSSGCPTTRAGSSPGCVSFGYPTGRWGTAERRPVAEVTYRNHWGGPPGLHVGEPLWPGRA